MKHRDAAWQSTARCFISHQGDKTLFVLRPVWVAPRPGVASVPVTLRAIWQRRQAVKS